MHGVNCWEALVLAVGGLGLVVERTLIRPLCGLGLDYPLLLTSGLSYVIVELVRIGFGNTGYPVDTPDLLQGAVNIGLGYFPLYRLFVISVTLSGGEQQMLAIARAMIASPRLIMLDEPSEGIMPVLVDEMFELFGQLKARGVTILLVEQNAELALAIAPISSTRAPSPITPQRKICWPAPRFRRNIARCDMVLDRRLILHARISLVASEMGAGSGTSGGEAS
jgi:hypothetical protein